MATRAHVSSTRPMLCICATMSAALADLTYAQCDASLDSADGAAKPTHCAEPPRRSSMPRDHGFSCSAAKSVGGVEFGDTWAFETPPGRC